VTPYWFRNPGSRYAQYVVAYALRIPVDAPPEFRAGVLREWQSRNGLPDSGVVDDATARAIGEVKIPWLIEQIGATLQPAAEEVRRLRSELGKSPTSHPDEDDIVTLVQMGRE
jgi:hypothetical protein